MSNAVLHCGDCLELMSSIPDGSVDMILCDLPYGTTACKWDTVIPFEPLWAQYKRVIKRNGAIVLFGSQPFTSALVMSNPKWFRYCWVWRKSRPNGFLQANRRPMKSHEDILVFSHQASTYYPQGLVRKSAQNKNSGIGNVYGKVYKHFVQNVTYTNYPRSVVDFPSITNPQHPTQKPVALMEYLIRTYTNEGETVLDCCFGSGTTGVACANTGRDFIGIEKDVGYFEIAQKRIEEAQSRARQLAMAI